MNPLAGSRSAPGARLRGRVSPPPSAYLSLLGSASEPAQTSETPESEEPQPSTPPATEEPATAEPEAPAEEPGTPEEEPAVPEAEREAPAEEEEAPVVVTATRIPQPKATVSARVEVIRREEIQKSGARTVAELLGTRGELDVRSYGPVGAASLPSLRGSAAGQVLVMVDGRRLNQPQGEGVDLGDINLTGVQRVEVLHGGASALYGSDAIGGVINLITTGAVEPEFRTAQGLGAFGLRSWSLQRSQSLKSLAYTLSLQRLSADNDYRFEAPGGEERFRRNSDFDQTALRLRLNPELPLPGKLDLGADWSDSNRGVAGLVQFPTPTARQRDRLRAVDLAYRSEEGRDGGWNARLYHQTQVRLYDEPKAFPIPIHSRQRVTTLGAEWTARRRFSSTQMLTLGLEERRERLNSSVVGLRPRRVHALYAQHQARLGAWLLLPALRLDATEGFGRRLSPHLGVVRRFGESLELKANAGGAFRTPGLNDLYWPADAFTVGNPRLGPESATTYDLGLSYSRGPVSTSLTLFRTETRGLIVWTPGALVPGKWSPINLGRSVVQGVEADASARTGRLTGRVSLTLMDPRDRSGLRNMEGKHLIFRPLSLGRLNLDYDAGPWGGGMDLVYTGKRYVTPDNLRALGGYFLTDLRLRRALSPTLALELQVFNVWDRRFELQPGYPMPGREWRLRLAERW